MSRHCLTQIDLIARTAVCSVCGPTKVHVSRPRTGNPSRVDCAHRYRASILHEQARRPRRFAAGQRRHILKEIDEGNRTAVCAICGPTDVYQTRKNGHIHYRCGTHLRALVRQNSGTHIVNPYARVHILSEIDEEKCTAICSKCGPVRIKWDPSLISTAGELCVIPGSGGPRYINKRLQENTGVVTEYKRRQACKRCGSMAVVGPNGFGFFEMHLPKEQRISMLVQKATPAELAAELEKRELYCKKCLGLVNKAFATNTPVPEFRPIPAFF